MKLNFILGLSLLFISMSLQALQITFIDSSGYPIFVTYNIATFNKDGTTIWSGVKTTPQVDSSHPAKIDIGNLENNQKVYIQSVQVEDFSVWGVNYCPSAPSPVKDGQFPKCITGCYMDNIYNAAFFVPDTQNRSVFCEKGVIKYQIN